MVLKVVRLWARRKPPLDTQWYLSGKIVPTFKLSVNYTNTSEQWGQAPLNDKHTQPHPKKELNK